MLGVRPGCSADEIRRALNAHVAAVNYSLDPQAAERLPQLYDAGAALLAQAADARAPGQIDLDARLRLRRRRARSAAMPVYLAFAFGLCVVYVVARPGAAMGAIWRMIDLVTGQPQWTVLRAVEAWVALQQKN